MTRNYYDTDRAAAEYLLLHYGTPPGGWPAPLREIASNHFPARCVTECLDRSALPANARALDLGCAVGRSSFELARHCNEVIGIDRSRQFITLANQLKKPGALRFECVDEGKITSACTASVPKGIKRDRVTFKVGDAMRLDRSLGTFDVVFLANLIDRLPNPRKCLAQLPGLLNAGGQLIITSPFTWLFEYTPRRHWLGGFIRNGRKVHSFDTLRQILAPDFVFQSRLEIPLVIREHSRKFQFGVAKAGVWTRE